MASRTQRDTRLLAQLYEVPVQIDRKLSAGAAQIRVVERFGRGAKLRRCPTVARHGLTLFKDKFVHKFVYRMHMDRVVVNAPSIRDDYARLGFDTSKISVILNGVRPVPARRLPPRPRIVRAIRFPLQGP